MKRLVVFAALCFACAHRPPRALVASDYPGGLTPPAEHPGNFIRRQTVVVRFHGRKESFEAVLQKQGNRLTMVGLTPFGSKAFVLQQTGTHVAFQSYFPHPMPFPPEFMLNDVERTYFRGISDRPLSDGWHEQVQDGERVREKWSHGRLLERDFVRLSGRPPGHISIVYVGGIEDSRSPPVIELENGWFGYHLTIDTLSEDALP